MNRPGDDDHGSTIPLILGFFLIGLIMVAGSVAAGDAFVHQRDLQSVCDGAAAAAVADADADTQRKGLADHAETSLVLGKVQDIVDSYLSRDPTRSGIQVDASLNADRTTVTARCARHSKVTFGAFFGRGDGVEQHATSSARAPVRAGP